MCEHREIDPTRRTIYVSSPLFAVNKDSYYLSVSRRVRAWTSLVTNLDKNKFDDMVYPLKLTQDEKQQLWILIAYAHYYLISPVAFFEFLMEVAIEEKTRFTSFATAEKLRKWPASPVPARFQDNFLVYLYLAIRDGERAFTLLNRLDIL